MISDSGQQEGEDMDPLSDGYSSDDQLNPVEKLEKYFQSDDPSERDMSVRCIVDAAYQVMIYSDFELILEIVCAMASDHEYPIRIGILGTVIPLLEKNTEFRKSGDTPFGQENEDRLYEIPVKMLNDFNQQVRRVSHNCVVSLLEDPRGSTVESLVRQLCSMIKRCLGKEENYDLRMDTALLISRVALLLGQNVCITYFIPLLPQLASDTMFHVRKAFAMCCKELCAAVGEACTEDSILPLFLQLAKDEVWGVRKACADVFMDVSASCSLTARQERLTPVFLHLLKDDSRWVRKAAFQSLGPFISTFYTPSLEENLSESLDPLGDSELLDSSLISNSPTHGSPVTPVTTTKDNSSTNEPRSPSHALSPLIIFQTPPHQVGSTPISPSAEGVEDKFGVFQFWRSPLPDVLQDALLPEMSSGENRSEDSAGTCSYDRCHDDEDDVTTCNTLNGTSLASINGLQRNLFGETMDECNEMTEKEREENVIDEDLLSDLKDELLAESQDEDLNHMSTTPTNIAASSTTVANGTLGSSVTMTSVATSASANNNDDAVSKVRVYVEATNGQVSEVVNNHRHTHKSEEGKGDVLSQHLRSMTFDPSNQTRGASQSTPVSTSRMAGSPGAFLHDSTLKSVAMEMTLMESAMAEPYSITTTRGKEIVPDELIEMYLSMVDPQKAQNIDSDLPFYCAYSFPAVLQTLGPSRWPLLKPMFEKLSGDLMWKIRRVLAYSLHEMARILGRDKTVTELVSTFDEYATKDLDDVKLGVLTHLADFFEVLPGDVRQDYFPSILQGLLDTENDRNWRYRNSLAEQLILLCDLYDHVYIQKHISPVALRLAHDKVAQVRTSASNLIGVILQKLDKYQPTSCAELLQNLRSSFATSERWLLRLMYAKQCEQFLQEKRIAPSLFSTECVPALLSLSTDEVANVRLVVGRLFNYTLIHIDFYSSDHPLSTKISETLETLQRDADKDVRYFAGAPLETPNPPNTPMEVPPEGALPLSRSLSDGECENKKLDISRAAILLHN